MTVSVGAVPRSSVATKAALVALTNPADGARIWVDSYRANFVFHVGSALSAAANEIIADTTATGMWVRETGGHPSWRKQTAWFFDSSTGDDENTGVDSSHKLKTLAEWARRVSLAGAYLVISSPDPSTNLAFILNMPAGTWPSTDPLTFDLALGPDSVLAVLGTRTQASSSTFTAAASAGTPASNTDPTLTDSVVNTWTAGTRIRTASANKVCWVAKDNGAHVARVNVPSQPNFADATTQSSWFGVTPTTTTIGSVAYVTETITKLTCGDMRVTTEKGRSAFAVLPMVVFQDIDFQADSGMAVSVPVGNAVVNYVACKFSAIVEKVGWESSFYFQNCCFAAGCTVFAGDAVFDTGLTLAPGIVAFSPAANVTIDGDFLSQGAPYTVANGAFMTLATAAVFDAASNAYATGACGLWVGAGCTAVMKNVQHGAHRLWGSGNTLGVLVNTGGKLLYTTTVPTVTGATKDFKLGADTSVLAQNFATGAYSASAVQCTWALLATAFASNGFGSNVTNPKSGAAILQL